MNKFLTTFLLKSFDSSRRTFTTDKASRIVAPSITSRSAEHAGSYDSITPGNSYYDTGQAASFKMHGKIKAAVCTLSDCVCRLVDIVYS